VRNDQKAALFAVTSKVGFASGLGTPRAGQPLKDGHMRGDALHLIAR